MVVIISRLAKRERHAALERILKHNPFMTDDELAKHFSVSIQTIRLDRLELGIPELRERIKDVAQNNLDSVRSLTEGEVIGEIIDLELDQSAISIFEITEEHVFRRTKIARGHYIFAQANSLAVAVIDGEVVLTAAARIRYIRPVKLGEKLISKAVVTSTQGNESKVRVETRVEDELVFKGTFRVTRINDLREGTD